MLLITWAAIDLMSDNPSLLRDFLSEVGVEDVLDRANLQPLLSNRDFMKWQHPVARLDSDKKQQAGAIVSQPSNRIGIATLLEMDDEFQEPTVLQLNQLQTLTA